MSALPDLRFHNWLWQPGDVRELRALGKYNKSGYFDTAEGLAIQAAHLTADPTIIGVYVSINPVLPELLGRSSRRVKQAKRGETTRDDQITCRRVMLVDCDPKRPSGINSTDEEHLLALELADRIRLELQEQGWPEPAWVDTGNGAALWFAVDLPTNDNTLVHRCLQALALRYDTEHIKIDLAVANASRIARIPGTVNRKGDNLAERPQRRCRYLTVPSKRTPVPADLLEALAATLPAPELPSEDRRDAVGWLDRWIALQGPKLGLQGPDPWKDDARIWTMQICPWNPEHDNGSAYVAQHANGRICAGCHHDSCSGNDWHALRDLVEPGWRNRGDYALTELGNAEMLVDNHGDKLRYVPEVKPHWLVFDGILWAYDACQAGHLANQVALKRLEDAQDKEQRKWALQSQSNATKNGTLAQAATIPGIALRFDQLDLDRWLLNFRNGTLDLRTGQLRPHDPADHLTRYLDMDYRHDAPCPLWEAFLGKIMGEDQEMVGFLQRALGYSLTGSTQEQKIFLLHGHGANGKSTLLETWLELMGNYARKADTETFLQGKKGAIREDLLDLQGARLVAVTEINEGRRLDEALVKEFSGGDRISTRGLYKERVNLRIEGKLWMATNDKPDIRSGGHGIWRRMLYVPFLVTIPEAEKDRELPYKLLLEGAGILAWAVRGCLAWQDQGLNPPQSVLDATKSYEAEQDLLAEWLEACCVVGVGCRASATELYDSFCAFAGEVYSKNMFFKRLAKRPGVEKDRNNQVRYWKGVGLLSSDRKVTPSDRKGDTKECDSGAVVTPMTPKPLYLAHDENENYSKPRFCVVTSSCEVMPNGDFPVTGVTGVTDESPSTSVWGSCKQCGVNLTGPTGGTGLCSACMPKARRER